MATRESIAIRRTAALERASAAMETIGQAVGATVAPYPDPHRDFDMRPAIEAEWLADALDAVADALTAPKAAPEATKAPETHAALPNDAKTAKGKDA